MGVCVGPLWSGPKTEIMDEGHRWMMLCWFRVCNHTRGVVLCGVVSGVGQMCVRQEGVWWWELKKIKIYCVTVMLWNTLWDECRSSIVMLLCVCWCVDEQHRLYHQAATNNGVGAACWKNMSPVLLCVLDEGVTHPTCCCGHVCVMCWHICCCCVVCMYSMLVMCVERDGAVIKNKFDPSSTRVVCWMRVSHAIYCYYDE